MELIYLDYNATTPVVPEVLEAMTPWFSNSFYNAGSAHAGGRMVSAAVESARAEVAEFFGCSANEVIFTSGATESNNLALKGIREAGGRQGRIVTVATEHHAVLDVVEEIQSSGGSATVVGVDAAGNIKFEELEEALSAGDVALVSVMAANNETGVLSDLGKISQAVRRAGALLHTDATQALGKIPLQWDNVDLLSFSGHKIGAPKGIGGLLVRKGTDVSPQIRGGGQERGMRSGTLNVPGIVGLAAALQVIQAAGDEAGRQAILRDRLERGLRGSLDHIEVVGASAERLPNTSNIRFVGADAEAVMVNCPSVAMSTGSACTALVPTASHVLLAMGLGNGAAECLRFSLGRGTTEDQIDAAIPQVTEAVRRVRELMA